MSSLMIFFSVTIVDCEEMPGHIGSICTPINGGVCHVLNIILILQAILEKFHAEVVIDYYGPENGCNVPFFTPVSCYHSASGTCRNCFHCCCHFIT